MRRSRRCRNKSNKIDRLERHLLLYNTADQFHVSYLLLLLGQTVRRACEEDVETDVGSVLGEIPNLYPMVVM